MNNPNQRPKGHMNVLIMIIVILVVDGLFLGYRALTHPKKSGAPTTPQTVRVAPAALTQATIQLID
ncbi:hypothetical protein [Levilactobacillus namurensis]|uniref:hypothetical protein n=1 Tax=Levilactobacillus namurensis TaxID=380393 RepID=UPI00222F21C8|nr:hypothetical protein [Levilactobacillus namurensis]MCW3778376.1 hypothetical protein [Levilactobacillus namurensis]MDT7019709.1 hypothetical protein [Levilactobacillus namurensis]WNN65703.1 hypothetical protein RIN67_01020 [Levilactobacillus namurensis]